MSTFHKTQQFTKDKEKLFQKGFKYAEYGKLKTKNTQQNTFNMSTGTCQKQSKET